MADFKKIVINGVTYNVKDEVARNLIAQLDGELDKVVTGGKYDSQSKEIQLTNGETVLAHIDATDFIKDGMVENVEVKDGKLVITFNTDSGKEDIEIEVSKIFDATNYYNKTEADGKFATKAALDEVSGDLEDALGEIATLEADKADKSQLANYQTKSEAQAADNALRGILGEKQDKLEGGYVEGVSQSGNVVTVSKKTFDGDDRGNSSTAINFKTVNGQSIFGTGDVAIAQVDAYTKEESDGKYETKADATSKLAEAKSYTDGKVAGLATEEYVDEAVKGAVKVAYDDASETLTLTFGA